MFGDGKDPTLIAGDLLYEEKYLENPSRWWKTTKSEGQKDKDKNEDPMGLAPIIKSRSKISEKLFELYEEGQTALGPALLASSSLASQVPGSKVVLCTDGLANIGVGSMDTTDSSVKDFYMRIAQNAISKGSTISLMSFKGSDSNIQVRCSMLDF